MPKVDRNDPNAPHLRSRPTRSWSSSRRSPTMRRALQWLWRTRFSPDGEHAYCEKCKQERVFKQLRRPSSAGSHGPAPAAGATSRPRQGRSTRVRPRRCTFGSTRAICSLALGRGSRPRCLSARSASPTSAPGGCMNKLRNIAMAVEPGTALRRRGDRRGIRRWEATQKAGGITYRSRLAPLGAQKPRETART